MMMDELKASFNIIIRVAANSLINLINLNNPISFINPISYTS